MRRHLLVFSWASGTSGDDIDDAVMVDVEGQCPVVEPAFLFGCDNLAENERGLGVGNVKE